jgi:hypothetical protein
MDFDIAYFKKNYTGKQINIALIREGEKTTSLNTITINSKINYNHYYIKTVLSIAPDANILDININSLQIDDESVSKVY